jgi:hypothetical protein
LSDGTLCLTGDNLDPSNDMAILVPGGNAICGDANAPIGDFFLQCRANSGSCGSVTGPKLLECPGLPIDFVPDEWTVCVCDTDAAGSCNVASNFEVQGSTKGAPPPPFACSLALFCARILPLTCCVRLRADDIL